MGCFNKSLVSYSHCILVLRWIPMSWRWSLHARPWVTHIVWVHWRRWSPWATRSRWHTTRPKLHLKFRHIIRCYYVSLLFYSWSSNYAIKSKIIFCLISKIRWVRRSVLRDTWFEEFHIQIMPLALLQWPRHNKMGK